MVVRGGGAPGDAAHPAVRREVTSCPECYAWGLSHAQGVCLACYNFAAHRFGHDVGTCGSCQRQVRLKKGHCRLCWHQAALDRTTGPNTPLAPWVRQVSTHQLFLAGMARRTAAPKTLPRRRGERGRPCKPAPPAAVQPRLDAVQLALFDQPVDRTYLVGRIDLRATSKPDNPWLRRALHLAHRQAETQGWSPVRRRAAQRVLTALLAEHRPGDLIHASAAQLTANRACINAATIIELLDDLDVLVEDRVQTFDRWLDRKLDTLPGPIRSDLHDWARALIEGGPRRRPRSPSTTVGYLHAVHKPVLSWAHGYTHLREVTAADIRDAVAALTGHARQARATALRSLFRWARREQRIFRDPTIGLRTGRAAEQLWQPLDPAEITQSVTAARSPQARVFVALAAVHSARTGHIRALQLDDVDLGNRRIRINGHDRPLDDLTHQLLQDWLTTRRSRWPDTANPHLLISLATAIGLGPLSATYLAPFLRRLPASIERLRIDRQLDEAIATHGDPLAVAATFGISHAAAIRYAHNARALLGAPHGATPDSPRTPVLSPGDRTEPHSGSR